MTACECTIGVGSTTDGEGLLRRSQTGKGSLQTHIMPVPIRQSLAPTAHYGVKSRFPNPLPCSVPSSRF